MRIYGRIDHVDRICIQQARFAREGSPDSRGGGGGHIIPENFVNNTKKASEPGHKECRVQPLEGFGS